MEQSKKCQECKSDIPKDAKRCSHCGAKQPISIDVLNGNGGWALLLFLLLLLLSVGIGIIVWYIAIPTWIIWYIQKKTNLVARKKQIATGLLVIFAIALISFNSYSKREPAISIMTPENGMSVQAESITITGKVSPKNSTLSINGNTIAVDNGLFSSEVSLKNESNTIQIVATNPKSDKQDTASLSVSRIFTSEELAEKERKRVEEETKIAEEKAQQEAKKEREEATWKASKAGKICTQNPTWTREECGRIADGEIWVGMHYNMLKYLRGLPDSVNESNYGYGTSYQVCWHDYRASCFYFDDDGIIDSYN